MLELLGMSGYHDISFVYLYNQRSFPLLLLRYMVTITSNSSIVHDYIHVRNVRRKSINPCCLGWIPNKRATSQTIARMLLPTEPGMQGIILPSRGYCRHVTSKHIPNMVPYSTRDSLHRFPYVLQGWVVREVFQSSSYYDVVILIPD